MTMLNDGQFWRLILDIVVSPTLQPCFSCRESSPGKTHTFLSDYCQDLLASNDGNTAKREKYLCIRMHSTTLADWFLIRGWLANKHTLVAISVRPYVKSGDSVGHPTVESLKRSNLETTTRTIPLSLKESTCVTPNTKPVVKAPGCGAPRFHSWRRHSRVQLMMGSSPPLSSQFICGIAVTFMVDDHC